MERLSPRSRHAPAEARVHARRFPRHDVRGERSDYPLQRSRRQVLREHGGPRRQAARLRGGLRLRLVPAAAVPHPVPRGPAPVPAGGAGTSRRSAGSRFHPGQKVPPTDWLHWTRSAANWNTMCSVCTCKDIRKRYDPDKDTYRTTWSEIAVGCEACHGPGLAPTTRGRRSRPWGGRPSPTRACWSGRRT